MATGAPTSVAVEIEFTAGVWTAVTTAVRGDSLEIKVGRDPGGDPQPGTCRFDLDNSDGTYTPDNPLSSLYPNLVEGKRLRVVVVKGSTSYRFLGWITTLEPELGESPADTLTHVEAVDALGMMARMGGLPDSLTAYVVGRGTAQAFWPLTDTNGAAGAADALGNYSPLTVWDYTASGGSCDWASDSSFNGGDAQYVAMTPGKGIWSASQMFSLVDASAAWAFNFVAKQAPSSSGEVFSLTAGRWAASRTRLSVQTLTVAKNTYYWLNYYLDGSLTGQSTSASVASGLWSYIAVYDFGDGVARMVVNDTLGGSSEVTVSHSGHDPYSHLSIGGNVTQSVGALGYRANAASVYSNTLVNGGAVGSELPTYISELANLSSLSATMQMDPTTPPYTTWGTLATSGKSALDVTLAAANGESGIVYHAYSSAATQVVKIRKKDATRSATVALTLDAEADLAGAPVLLREIGRRAATALASNSVKSVSATDSTAPATAGAARVEVSATVQNDGDLYAVASDAIAKTRDQSLRVSQVTFDLWTASTDLYASWFATVPGSRVRVSNLPSTYLGVTYMDGYVAGWTERPMVSGYPVTLDLEPVPYNEAVWDTARFGWGDGVCTASSLTSSGTSATLTWTGGLSMSTSAGDYPMDININGERCTISSAPAGSASPQTVTIVRGVAPTVARAHSAGDTVEVWDVGRWAF